MTSEPVARWALGWAVLFTAAHAYWYLGGRVGLGDAPSPLPGVPTSVIGWSLNGVVLAMFLVGIAAPLALLRPWGQRIPRKILLTTLWVGCVVLGLRGGAGLLDDLLRDLGIADHGVTGLDYQQTLGQAHPSAYTLWSTAVIDAYFVYGGLLFGGLAKQVGLAPRVSAREPDLV